MIVAKGTTDSLLLLLLLLPTLQEELKDLAEFDVVVASYETLNAEGSFLKKRFLWRMVVVDEGRCSLNKDKSKKKNDRDKDKSQLAQKLKQVRVGVDGDGETPVGERCVCVGGNGGRASRETKSKR